MSDTLPTILRVADLPNKKPTRFSLTPNKPERDSIAEVLGIVGVRKLTFQGELRPSGKKDWHLTAKLGSTVVQNCVVTLTPVTTRIDTTVERHFLADMPEQDDAEMEMPEDDSIEALGDVIDLESVMTEALSIEMPDYPRNESAVIEEANFTEPGKEAMTDDDAKPFAALASLKEKLEKSEKD